MLIMTLVAKSLSSVSVRATRVAASGIAGVISLTKALTHRRAVLRLSELDERGLKDIGLVRSDVEGALAASWLNDPSAILASRSTATSGVASARRDEALRQAQAKPPVVNAKPVAPTGEPTIACSA